ncbi:MAG: type II secretion system protein GspM [Halothiobacillaceae bacterium]
MSAWLEFWRGRQPRERIAITLALLALLVLAFDSLVHVPLREARESAEARLESNRELVAWMRQAVTEIQRQGGPPDQSTSSAQGSPMLAAERLAAEAGIVEAMQRRQPAGNSGVRVEFEAVTFEDLLGWIDRMQQQEALEVTRARIAPVEGVPGQVEAMLVLERDS